MANFLTTYLREAVDELKRVTWPSKKEATRDTLVVIALSLGIALFLGVLDYIFNLGLQQLLYRG